MTYSVFLVNLAAIHAFWRVLARRYFLKMFYPNYLNRADQVGDSGHVQLNEPKALRLPGKLPRHLAGHTIPVHPGNRASKLPAPVIRSWMDSRRTQKRSK